MTEVNFKEEVNHLVEKLLNKKGVSYRREEFVAGDGRETMDLIEISYHGVEVTISNEFVLVVYENSQYDFEKWRYEDSVSLENDVKSFLLKTLSD